jgi:hypothetical protein
MNELSVTCLKYFFFVLFIISKNKDHLVFDLNEESEYKKMNLRLKIGWRDSFY